MRAALALLALPALAVAQVPKMPTQAEIDAALNAMRPAIEQAGRAQPVAPQRLDSEPAAPVPVPDVRAAPAALPPAPAAPPGSEVRLPSPTVRPDTGIAGPGSVPPHLLAPAAKPIDLEGLVQRYESASKPEEFARESLILFVSFSIPEPKLKQLLADAAGARATVVFRGGLNAQDMTMTQLVKRLLALRVRPMPKVQVHPPLFTRFRVEVAPTWVLSLPRADQTEPDGCAPAGTYAAVSGDVRSHYALTLMARRADEQVARVAQALLDREKLVH